VIGQRIKKLREKKKMSQRELGVRTRIFNQSQISKIENNERYLKADELKIIADALGVAVIELVDRPA
jgi:transcriptional regulator with XRE-family HTH domain